MDDRDRVERSAAGSDDIDDTANTEEVVDKNAAWPPAVAGGNVTGTEGTSGSMGTLAGGLLGSIVARDIVDQEIPEEERVAGADGRDTFGDRYTETGDQGVSPAQKEAEADELNG